MRAASAPTTDVEESVLTMLLHDLPRMVEARSALTPDDFSTAGRAVLFATMAGVVEAAEGEEVAIDDIAGQLEVLRGMDGRAGEIAALGLEVLGGLLSAAPPTASAERLRFDLRRVREMAEVRRALREAPSGTAVDALAAAAGEAGHGGAGEPAETPGALDLEGKFRLLKRLHADELITDEEYAKKRKQLLDSF